LPSLETHFETFSILSFVAGDGVEYRNFFQPVNSLVDRNTTALTSNKSLKE